MLKVVLLILTVYNYDTGEMLFRSMREMPSFSISGNRMEDCRVWGLAKAKELTAHYRVHYPNASTNVDCQWVDREGQDL